MKTSLTVCALGAALAIGAVAPDAASQPLVRANPRSDRCETAQSIAPGVTVVGDLRRAANDSNEMITATRYQWQGRDQFFALFLRAGQTVTFGLVEQGGWDGGVYVFTRCDAINASTVGGLDTSATTPFRFTARASGHYIVAVDAWRPDTGAGYVLNVSR